MITRLGAAGSTQGGSTVTLAHAVGAADERCLMVALTTETGTGEAGHDSMTYGTEAMIKLVEIGTGTSGFTHKTSIWEIREAGIAAASSTIIDPTFTINQPAEVQIHAQAYQDAEQAGGATSFPDTNTAFTTASTPNPLISDVAGVIDGAVFAARGSGNASSFTWVAPGDLSELTDETDGSSGGSSADLLTTVDGNVDVEGTASSQNRGSQVAVVIAPAPVDVLQSQVMM